MLEDGEERLRSMIRRQAIVGAVLAGWLAVAMSPEALAQPATRSGAADGEIDAEATRRLLTTAPANLKAEAGAAAAGEAAAPSGWPAGRSSPGCPPWTIARPG